MIFKKKVEVINWNDFFENQEIVLTKKEMKSLNNLLAGSMAVYLIHPGFCAAGSIEDKIISAFNPLINLMQGISYPITFLMLSGGFILIIMGQKSKGLMMIKWAAVGYIGLQFAPAIMQILVGVGKAMMIAK